MEHVAISVVGTAVWAIQMGEWGGDIRLPLIACGVLSCLSFAVWPLQGDLAAMRPVVGVALGVLLAVYQHSLGAAVRAYGSTVQAVVNCNVAVIVVHQVLTSQLPLTTLLALLLACAVSSAAALVIYGVHLREMVVPG